MFLLPLPYPCRLCLYAPSSLLPLSVSSPPPWLPHGAMSVLSVIHLILSDTCPILIPEAVSPFLLFIQFAFSVVYSSAKQSWSFLELLSNAYAGKKKEKQYLKKAVRKSENLVDLDKCCKMSHWSPKSVLIQPRKLRKE